MGGCFAGMRRMALAAAPRPFRVLRYQGRALPRTACQAVQRFLPIEPGAQVDLATRAMVSAVRSPGNAALHSRSRIFAHSGRYTNRSQPRDARQVVECLIACEPLD